MISARTKANYNVNKQCSFWGTLIEYAMSYCSILPLLKMVTFWLENLAHTSCTVYSKAATLFFMLLCATVERLLRWLDTVFQGQYKFEHKLRRQKQRFGKISTTVVLDKDKNLLWPRLQWHWSCDSNEMSRRYYLFNLQQYFSALGTVLKSFTVAFSSNSHLDVHEV